MQLPYSIIFTYLLHSKNYLFWKIWWIYPVIFQLIELFYHNDNIFIFQNNQLNTGHYFSLYWLLGIWTSAQLLPLLYPQVDEIT